ncbi:MAG: hypothetical protein PWP44_134 [Thermacetogenium sp.]|nr:hypothetical protein [Thermacetogenium sp.]
MYETALPGLLRVEEHTAQLSREKAREFQRAFKDREIAVLSSSTTFELGVDLGDLDVVFLRNIPPEAFNYAQRVGRAGRRPGRCGFAITYCRRSPHDLYHFARPDRMLKGHTTPPILRLRNERILLRHMTAVVLGRFFRAHPTRFGEVRHFFVDLLEPRAVSDVRRFLEERKPDLEAILRTVVPWDMWAATGLNDGTWVDLIAGRDAGGQPSRLLDAEAELASDYRRVRQLERESSEQRDHGRAEWAKRRARDLEKEDVLSFLSRKAVIPKYGFPVDVVGLDTQGKGSEVDLQRDRGIAITEYAPTAKIVANKKLWESYGVKLVPERAWPRRRYRKCTVHNRFDVWDEAEGEKAPGPPCCDRMTRPKTYIRRGNGFYVCPACGAGFRDRKVPHRSPQGLECRTPPDLVMLGHEFTTDVVRVDFLCTPPLGIPDLIWFTYSVAYALAGGASEVLEVPSTDLSATVGHPEGRDLPPIILYDNVPGSGWRGSRSSPGRGRHNAEVPGGCSSSGRRQVRV